MGTVLFADDFGCVPDGRFLENASIEAGSVLGSGCTIHSGARIVRSFLGDRVTVFNHSVITDSRIAKKVQAVFEADWAQTAPAPKSGKEKEREKDATPVSVAG